MEKKKNRLLDYQSTLAIDIKMGVSLNKVYITTLHLVSSSSSIWVTIQAKNNVGNAPASTALAYVLHLSHNMFCKLSATQQSRKEWSAKEKKGELR